MNNIFNYDNGFFRVVNKIVDGFWASILWFIFSLPVVTFGASTTAFYYTVHKSLRGNRGYVWRSFGVPLNPILNRRQRSGLFC